MKLGKQEKQPIERWSYTVNYANNLTEGDVIATVNYTVTPSGELVVDQNIILAGIKAKFWVAGGIDLKDYKVTITATSEDGLIIQDELIFKVRET